MNANVINQWKASCATVCVTYDAEPYQGILLEWSFQTQDLIWLNQLKCVWYWSGNYFSENNSIYFNICLCINVLIKPGVYSWSGWRSKWIRKPRTQKSMWPIHVHYAEWSSSCSWSWRNLMVLWKKLLLLNGLSNPINGWSKIHMTKLDGFPGWL